MHVLSVGILALALLSGAGLTRAGEVILFEQAEFGGRTLTLRGAAPNLNRVNFNDRASSIRVLSGLWQLCTDANFRGQCVQFGPGNYPHLGGQANAFSSVREVSRDTRNSPQPASGDNAVVLFDQEGFRGRRLGIDFAVADLEPTGFNDRARSLIVRSGVWEVCTDSDYGGRCRIFRIGEYPALELELSEQISSARPADLEAGDRRSGGAPGLGAGHGGLILYEHDNFGGESRILEGPVGDFGQFGFNEKVSSLVVRRGLWELCTGAQYQGLCHVYRPGEYRAVGPRFNDRFSSARPVGQ